MAKEGSENSATAAVSVCRRLRGEGANVQDLLPGPGGLRKTNDATARTAVSHLLSRCRCGPKPARGDTREIRRWAFVGGPLLRWQEPVLRRSPRYRSEEVRHGRYVAEANGGRKWRKMRVGLPDEIVRVPNGSGHPGDLVSKEVYSFACKVDSWFARDWRDSKKVISLLQSRRSRNENCKD